MAPPRVDHAQARHEQPHELAPVARAPVLVERILLVGADQHAQPIAMAGAEVREAGLRARLGQQLLFVELSRCAHDLPRLPRARARIDSPIERSIEWMASRRVSPRGQDA